MLSTSNSSSSSSIPRLILPAVIKQQHDRSGNSDRVHDDNRQFSRKIQRSVLVAERQWAEYVAL